MAETPAKSHPEALQRQLYDASFCIVAARFNAAIVDILIDGARQTLLENGVSESAIHVVRVPGAFELPLAAQAAARTGRYDGLIALGAVVRGGTPHFEYVSGECTRSLGVVSLEHNIPLGNGVLTVDTMAQAVDRAGGSEGHKGAEAALAAVEMVSLLRELGA